MQLDEAISNLMWLALLCGRDWDLPSSLLTCVLRSHEKEQTWVPNF